MHRTPNDTEMNLVCSCDDKYLDYCLIMIKSLRKHHTKEAINIFILHSGINTQKIESFKNDIGYKSNITINFCEVKNEIFNDAPVSYHLTIATYYRILMTEILPDSIDKVLYLDCDILIRKPLNELWNINLTSYPVAAAIAAGMHNYPIEIGLNEKSLYFNAGIMLVNLDYWRKNDIYTKSIRTLETHNKIIKWWDQDILNIIFEGKWLPIMLTWNSQPYLYENIEVETADVFTLYDTYQYKYAIQDPAIVHYAGGSKPWHFNDELPFFFEYLSYINHGRLKFLIFKLKRFVTNLLKRFTN